MAYNQLELHPDCRYISNFSTHLDLFRYKRLFFGCSSASEVFQDTIANLLSGIEGVNNISDDIIIHGRNTAEHDSRLHAVIQRLIAAGLTLWQSKCELNKQEIDFYGHRFSAQGVAVHPKHKEQIVKMNRPTNASEVRSLLSMVSYSSRFIENLSSISEPLRNLTKSQTQWQWGDREEESFQQIKQKLIDTTFTSYFDPNLHTQIIVDAGPVGLSAILVQIGSDKTRRVISYASKSLTDTERRYSQTEKEAYACVWGCEHHHKYIYGAKSFDLITDHKALEVIYGNPMAKLPARIERWGLRLMPYTFNILHTRWDSNPSDYLSRHPDKETAAGERSTKITEEYINFVIDSAAPVAIGLEAIKRATKTDPVLQRILTLIQTGVWNEAANDPALRSYYNVKDELCANADSDIVLRGTRIVLPASLHALAIKLAHQGHQGIVRSKRLLRSKVWFPDVDRLMENEVRNCIPCQATTPEHRTEQLHMSQLPDAEWQHVSADFLGPLDDGSYLLVLICEYSRYPVVEIVHSTSSIAIIPVLDRIFALLGTCNKLKTDNGPPWNSAEFAQFADYLGF